MNAVMVFFPILFALSLLAITIALRLGEAEDKKNMAGRLRDPESEETGLETKVVVEQSDQNERLATLLARSNLFKKMGENIQQADLNWSASTLLVMMAASCVVGALAGIRFKDLLPAGISSIVLGSVFGALPYLYVLQKRGARLAQIESYFPEALDFLARSMRAGHALTVSLEMLSKESPAPLGPEFRRLFNEHNLGAPLEVALRHLVIRVPLPDVRFFVSAVLLQRETGGNLSEILTKLASLIRERFTLKGQVRAASAHGRMTAAILGVLPIVLTVALLFVAPGYLQGLTKDPDGRYMIIGALAGQVAGYVCMRKIINIRV